MDLAKRLRWLVLAGFVLNVGLALLIAGTRHSEHWLAVALVSLIVVDYLYFKHLARIIKREVLLPFRELQLTLAATLPATKAIDCADLQSAGKLISTSLVEARERERMIADDALEVICSFDSQGKILAMNPAVYKQWGFPASALVGKELARYVYPDDRAALQAVLTQATAEGTGMLEARIVTGSGDLIDVEWQIEWSQSTSAYFSLMRNITDRKNLERAKQQFVSMISHDLRSPLASVRLTLQAMLAQRIEEKIPADHPDVRGLDRSLRSISRVVDLTNQLLDIDRSEAGQLVLTIGSIAVEQLFAEALASLEPLASQKGVTLTTRNSTAIVEADRERIVQVLVNLVANAIKFTESGGTVRMYVTEAPDHITVNVADDGRGIPKANQKAIFDRFRQVRKSDASSGSGLGLPICKLLVEAHGTRLTVESEEGKGSCFSFKLPRSTT